MQTIEASFYIPHCSKCCAVFYPDVHPYKAACSHLFCASCASSHASKSFFCPIDTYESEVLPDCQDLTDLIKRVLSEDRPDCDETVDAIFDDINVQSVPCRYLSEGKDCPSRVKCRYHHGIGVRKNALKISSGVFCSVCNISVTKDKAYCPFCLKAVTHVPDVQQPIDSILGNQDMFKSMEPSFPDSTDLPHPSDPPHPDCPADYFVVETIKQDEEDIPIQISPFRHLLWSLFRWLNDHTTALFAVIFKPKEPQTMTFT